MYFKAENLTFHKLGPFSFVLQKGESIGIMGPSGAGKTLLLRALADLEPHEGHVWLDGTEARQVTPPLWRQRVRLIPAESQWWFDTVGEHFYRTLDEWIDLLGFPENVMSWQISRLSSGEKQRLGLLRALQDTPPVLLLDEPTANLDQENTERVETLLRQYRQQHDASFVWVSHHREQLDRVADAAYLLKDNTLQPEGWS